MIETMTVTPENERPARDDSEDHALGDFVHIDEVPITRYTVRVIVGVEDDGTCVTSLITPPPWMTTAESTRFHNVDQDQLQPVPDLVARELELLPV